MSPDRDALRKTLVDGMGSLLLSRLPGLDPLIREELADRLSRNALEVLLPAPCGFAWAWEGSDDDHLHACHHPDAHYGRHVCRCRSWQPRDTQREEAQNVAPAGRLHLLPTEGN